MQKCVIDMCMYMCNGEDGGILVSREHRHAIRPAGTGKSFLVLLTE